MLICRICDKENEEDSRFCRWCGAPLQTSASTGLLPPQSLLQHGRYQIIKRLGQGGMGAVYQACDLQQQRVVAVKEMSQNGLSDEELREAIAAFTREAELLARLDHHSLPRIYEQFEDQDRRYLVMEFIEGVTLEQYLGERQQKQKSLETALVLDIGMQLCVVLDYLHTRQPPIIFRDLKPANIMLTPQGQVYLIDFGIARLFRANQTKDTVALGSPGYASPEQYRQATSPSSDLYSLGVVLHQLLTGDDPIQNPFHFKPFSLNMPKLEKLVMQMVEAEETKRPAGMKHVLRALDAIKRGGTGKDGRRVQPGRRDQWVPGERTGSAGFKLFRVSLLISAATRDRLIGDALRDYLAMLLNAIPGVSIQRNGSHADLTILLLSDGFLGSSTCLANAEDALARAATGDGKVLAYLVCPCAWQTSKLGSIALALPETIAHPSLYAQEQRIVAVARSIRLQLVAQMLQGTQAGPMNLLLWLLWQFYSNGGNVCPYFVVGGYAIKYMRASQFTGILFSVSDLQSGQEIMSYTLDVHNSTRLSDLLALVAPQCASPVEVLGIAMSALPQLTEIQEITLLPSPW
ncbi:serine/threonine protein kinase [Dictyobacter aurantiacus]|uniref:Protein kinase domain-containing protein n=1 Tax=Dictyobacter aurantiacus TaxID=1936993 RepID=A0A401Z9G8_9CHLR|nr:serine/threonine-protein kinase [Dictyobacter aurantiacus]GCE03495.1 hypothetical protein KDAU_08240 [Dictyobacter aurantiacus]